MNNAVDAVNAPKAVGHYPHARHLGNLLFLSGIGPRLPSDNSIPGNQYNTAGELTDYDMSAQCHSVFANVKAVLEASECSWQDLVDVTVYLTNMQRDFSIYNAIWAEYFPDAAKAPCRTTLGITALPTPIAIELKCIAAIKEKTGMLLSAFNLQEWIDAHRHLLKPPVGNKCIVDDEFIVMVVGGPNARTDYHFEDGPEWFYQLEGEMLLKLQIEGKVVDVPIKAGEIYYLPPHIPHSPQRMPDSIGLVIERKRLAHEQDGLMWFCEQCNAKLYEQFFHLENIETQFAGVFAAFYSSKPLRTCKSCGVVHAVPEKYAHYES